MYIVYLFDILTVTPDAPIERDLHRPNLLLTLDLGQVQRQLSLDVCGTSFDGLEGLFAREVLFEGLEAITAMLVLPLAQPVVDLLEQSAYEQRDRGICTSLWNMSEVLVISWTMSGYARSKSFWVS